ncbi:hypothetical protein UPYG_G00348110 [Umbra pygmaea]|uniref:Uncharacterized protein n=1 Tax=Umbra pygmaea TaxID=75934 RepID=A0ABD0W230_UMBPY
MVEHRIAQSRFISLQAGPGEVDATLSDQNVRMHARAVQTIGRQLAEIGDRLDREWAARLPNPWNAPYPLHVARPVHVLTRSIYRGIQGYVWSMKSLSGVAKAWLVSAFHCQTTHRVEVWVSWVSSIQPIWAKATLAAVALVAMATICTALWKE